MREILFRGIIKNDNSRHKRGQWAFGDLVRLQDGNDGKLHIYGCGEVLSETVGQYIGLTDKNGKKIFEGDIVKDDVGRKCEVEYVKCYYYPFVAFPDYRCWYEKDCEIIGNIHDNPELLKEREGK